MLHPHHIKANGKVDLWNRSEGGDWTSVEMFATDAKHALEADARRIEKKGGDAEWSLEKPKPERSKPVLVEDEEADLPADNEDGA